MKDRNLVFPNFCQWEITTDCNSRCKHCMVWKITHKPVPLEIILNGIDVVVAAGIKNIELIGGEPLLYENLFEVLEYLNTQDKIEQFAVLTNGIDLQKLEKVLPEIKKGKGWIVVSINYTEEQCDELNKVGEDVRKSMAGWEILKRFSKSCNIRVNCTINSINVSTFPKIAQKVIEIGGFFSLCPIIYKRQEFNSGLEFTFRSPDVGLAPIEKHKEAMRRSSIELLRMKKKYQDKIVPNEEYIRRLSDFCKDPTQPYSMNCSNMGLPYLRISSVIGISEYNGECSLKLRACSDMMGQEISRIVISDLRISEIRDQLPAIFQTDPDVVKCCKDEGCCWSVTYVLK